MKGLNRIYSLRRESAGLVQAAFKVLDVTAAIAVNNVISPAIRSVSMPTGTLP